MEKFGGNSFEVRVFTPEKIQMCIDAIRKSVDSGWDGSAQRAEDSSDILIVAKAQDISVLKDKYLVFFEIKVDEVDYIAYDAPRER